MRPPKAGLICAGGVRRSLVARMPALLATVCAVKAGSLRVARRIANALRIGSPVENYCGLAGCDVIWVAVADDALDRVARELAAETRLAGIPTVLCDSVRDSSALRRRAAASVNAPDDDGRMLVAEGDALALRYLRRLAAADGRKLVEIHPGSKALFLAGVRLATDLALPWIAAAVESLRAAGFSRIDATRAVEELGSRTARSYAKAGWKAWRPGAAAELMRALNARLGDPRLQEMHRDGIERALRFFEKQARSS